MCVSPAKQPSGSIWGWMSSKGGLGEDTHSCCFVSICTTQEPGLTGERRKAELTPCFSVCQEKRT